MSRGVRDLRDLICVSRLTFRASDDEEDFISDDDQVVRDFDNLSLSSAGSTDSLRGVNRHISPDSGCATNGSTPPETAVEPEISKSPECKPTVNASLKTDKQKRKRRQGKNKQVNTLPARHEFPKKLPLPPVQSSGNVSYSPELDVDLVSQPLSSKQTRTIPVPPPQGNYDNMLCYMDATVVSNWLTRANESVISLTKFCNSNDNFVQFAHFWLTDFPDLQKKDIFELEHGILLEELGFAFAVGREQRKVNQRDLLNLIGALFREYPTKLLNPKGSYLFLNYLEFLSSEKKTDYKTILSDVKCSTKNKQYAQWLLATRSFALVSLWSAIVNFYRNLVGTYKDSVPTPTALSHTDKDINLSRMYQAIRLGHSDVVHYYFVSGKVDPQQVDSHNRTFIFTAVMHNQSDVLNYLMKQVKKKIDINLPADTGNTPLHAAANNGNTKLVTALLKDPDIDVNSRNIQCENATPLHLAVMHGHRNVVELLLKNKADVNMKMGDLTAKEIARDFGHSKVERVPVQREDGKIK